MRQVAGALDAVHQRGIVHRDLKPSNILLDIQGNAYLTDFGIAKELEVDTHMTHPGTFLGSPAYISPEQLRNEAVTPQTDIYSLGIILYELLTGKHPFITDNLAPLIQQHLNEPLPSLLEDYAHLPVAVDWVLARATAKHPAARYNDVLAFLEDFEQALLAQPDFDKLSLRTETPAEPVEAPSSIVHRPSPTVPLRRPRTPINPSRIPPGPGPKERGSDTFCHRRGRAGQNLSADPVHTTGFGRPSTAACSTWHL
jgi:serine/threonine protein kinase